MKITSLGYLRVESPDAKDWATFGPEVLGLAVSEDPLGRPNTVALTNDDRPGRIVITEGQQNRLQCAGWELPSAEDLADAVEELERAGVAAQRATAEQCEAARVRDLVSFTDPAGFTHELFYGQLVVPGSFKPGRAMSGFVTGGQGLGHIVLVVPDLVQSLDFYRKVLGFRISDEIDMGGNRLIFFHVNPRHHTLAIMAIPGMRGLHHLMLQVDSVDDVGRAHDLCLDRKIPLAMTLGRHTNDRMLSFYLRSPSGFEIEYGWGAQTVDDEDDWVVTHMKSTSIWGHRPGDAPAPGCVEPIQG
ncbi:VOC family protein [Pseudonocardia acidicola]|uniref:Glyoxalase n=1 Tax=Pseudonocardia acidicola TaxID=2724939 RepID=A0ABX1SB07_9PSEU|nr:VOC family protein [Pseudonocardia acidicola]NMH97363.1 glyoxalase [Pseudonocardia acidicola]